MILQTDVSKIIVQSTMILSREVTGGCNRPDDCGNKTPKLRCITVKRRQAKAVNLYLHVILIRIVQICASLLYITTKKSPRSNVKLLSTEV